MYKKIIFASIIFIIGCGIQNDNKDIKDSYTYKSKDVNNDITEQDFQSNRDIKYKDQYKKDEFKDQEVSGNTCKTNSDCLKKLPDGLDRECITAWCFNGRCNWSGNKGASCKPDGPLPEGVSKECFDGGRCDKNGHCVLNVKVNHSCTPNTPLPEGRSKECADGGICDANAQCIWQFKAGKSCIPQIPLPPGTSKECTNKGICTTDGICKWNFKSGKSCSHPETPVPEGKSKECMTGVCTKEGTCKWRPISGKKCTPDKPMPEDYNKECAIGLCNPEGKCVWDYSPSKSCHTDKPIPSYYDPQCVESLCTSVKDCEWVPVDKECSKDVPDDLDFNCYDTICYSGRCEINTESTQFCIKDFCWEGRCDGMGHCIEEEKFSADCCTDKYDCGYKETKEEQPPLCIDYECRKGKCYELDDEATNFENCTIMLDNNLQPICWQKNCFIPRDSYVDVSKQQQGKVTNTMFTKVIPLNSHAVIAALIRRQEQVDSSGRSMGTYVDYGDLYIISLISKEIQRISNTTVAGHNGMMIQKNNEFVFPDTPMTRPISDIDHDLLVGDQGQVCLLKTKGSVFVLDCTSKLSKLVKKYNPEALYAARVYTTKSQECKNYTSTYIIGGKDKLGKSLLLKCLSSTHCERSNLDCICDEKKWDSCKRLDSSGVDIVIAIGGPSPEHILIGGIKKTNTDKTMVIANLDNDVLKSQFTLLLKSGEHLLDILSVDDTHGLIETSRRLLWYSILEDSITYKNITPSIDKTCEFHHGTLIARKNGQKTTISMAVCQETDTTDKCTTQTVLYYLSDPSVPEFNRSYVSSFKGCPDQSGIPISYGIFINGNLDIESSPSESFIIISGGDNLNKGYIMQYIEGYVIINIY